MLCNNTELKQQKAGVEVSCQRAELVAEGAAVNLGRKLRKKTKNAESKAYILNVNSAKILGDS